MKSTQIISLVCLCGGGVALAQSAADRDTLAKIRTEGLEHSQVRPVFDYLTIDIGPRLTASPAHKRAAQWTRDRLASYGLTNPRLEPWKFGRGWELKKLTVEMTEPRYLPLIAYADGWSASTSGEIAAAPVLVAGKSPEDLASIASSLKGAIVLTQPTMTSFIRKDRPQPSDEHYEPMSAAYATSVGARRPAPGEETPQQRGQRMAAAFKAAGAGVLVRPSAGEHGTVFVTGRDGGPGAVPSMTIAGEQYNMILRYLERNIP